MSGDFPDAPDKPADFRPLHITIYKHYPIKDIEREFGTQEAGSPTQSCTSSSSAGQPGFWEGLIPIWGSGRSAIDDFQNGRWGWGLFNAALAVSDIFLIKALATGALKLIAKTAGKEILESAGKEGAEIIAKEATETSGRELEAILARAESGAIAVTDQEAKELLISQGMESTRAADYVASFEGQVSVRYVEPGEQFFRYTGQAESKGSFLTKEAFSSPGEAVDALYLPYGNPATGQQLVTAGERTFVLEGSVRNGNATQTLIPDINKFIFGTGEPF